MLLTQCQIIIFNSENGSHFWERPKVYFPMNRPYLVWDFTNISQRQYNEGNPPCIVTLSPTEASVSETLQTQKVLSFANRLLNVFIIAPVAMPLSDWSICATVWARLYITPHNITLYYLFRLTRPLWVATGTMMKPLPHACLGIMGYMTDQG